MPKYSAAVLIEMYSRMPPIVPAGIYELSDDVAPEAFEAALYAAKAEGAIGIPSSGVSSSITGLPKPSDFAKPSELYPNPKQAGIYDLSDDVESDDFDAALDEAKAEGNMSRANVAGLRGSETRPVGN